MKEVIRKIASVCLFVCLAFSYVRAQSPQAQRVAYDYSEMYETLNPSIVKIHADGTTGSGFLVAENGIIATNHHVVQNSRYIAVQFADGRKVRGEIIVLNPRYDLAPVKVNSSMVSSMRPLALLPPDRDSTVKPGIPVVAFGSPLSQTFLITQGIVSKVEEEVLSGDFLVGPGNSGGPLVNLDGEVVGINTFWSMEGKNAGLADELRRQAIELAEPAESHFSRTEFE
ncbi:MAG: trypsin-like peptidase domain-containing protein [Blastocatellia bacterium]|nr:trypsin-like peptidase domain-containing protein [Blastocatellia bacterium]